MQYVRLPLLQHLKKLRVRKKDRHGVPAIYLMFKLYQQIQNAMRKFKRNCIKLSISK